MLRPTPFVAEVKWSQGHLTTAIPPRYWWYEHPAALTWCPDSNMPSRTAKAVKGNIGTCRDAPCITNTLVDAVRLIAKTNSTVGENCMTIWLPPPQYLCAEIEFIPQSEHTAVLKHRVADEVSVGPFPIAFSPWIVGHAFVSKPSLTVGGMNFSLGPWRVAMKAPEREFHGIHFAWSSQHRPRRPR